MGHRPRLHGEAGNLLSSTDALGRTTGYAYDDAGLRTTVTYPDLTTQLTGYDGLGRRISVTDPSGRITRYRYDAVGRLVEVRQYLDPSLAAGDADFGLAPTEAGVASSRYAYDEFGHEVSQTDALGRVTTFAYDSLGRRTQRTLPGGQVETYGYDAGGNLVSKRDFNGFTTTYTYDALNRLTEKDADPKHPSLALGHASAKITYEFNAMGQRSAATIYNAAGTALYTETLAYDTRNRLTSKFTTNGTLRYTYDAQGNLASVASDNNSGTDVQYQYDPLNRLSSASVLDPFDGNRKVTNYTYDKVGNLGGVALPNTVMSSYTYDALNRLTNLSVARVGTLLASYAYTLDRSGHRTSVSELNGRQHAYEYDALYRLTTESITGGTGDPTSMAGVNPTGSGFRYLG